MRRNSLITKADMHHPRCHYSINMFIECNCKNIKKNNKIDKTIYLNIDTRGLKVKTQNE